MAWMRLSNGQSNALKTDENIIPNGKTHHEKVKFFLLYSNPFCI